jgi:transcriptional regulator with XRE-family HTH domain
VGEKPVKSLRSAEYDKLLTLLKGLRAEAGMTQKELCNRIGQEITYVSKVERGTRRIDGVELLLYIEALGFDPPAAISKLWKQLRNRS